MSIPTTSGKAGAALAYCAALTFTLASAGTNAIYGFSRGSDFASSAVWASVSVAASIVMALSFPALLGSLERRNGSRAFMAVLALLLTGAYSVTAALGSAAGGRTNATNQEQTTTTARTRAQAAYDTTKEELAKLAPARPASEVEALLVTARPICRIVVTTGSRQTVCTKPPALLAELGRAKRRAELEQRLERSSADLSKAGVARVANSDAAALAAYLSVLGFETTTERLNKLLVLLAVVVVECGGGLALAVGMSLTGETNTRTAPVAARVEAPREPPRRAFLRMSSMPAQSPAGVRLLEFVQARGGTVVGGQRALGKAMGVSRTRVSQLLREQTAAGRIKVTTCAKGTAVRLVTSSSACCPAGFRFPAEPSSPLLSRKD